MSRTTHLEDPNVLAAMRALLAADEALAAATTDRERVERADNRAVAALALRRRLVEAGWSAPSSQRSST